MTTSFTVWETCSSWKCIIFLKILLWWTCSVPHHHILVQAGCRVWPSVSNPWRLLFCERKVTSCWKCFPKHYVIFSLRHQNQLLPHCKKQNSVLARDDGCSSAAWWKVCQHHTVFVNLKKDPILPSFGNFSYVNNSCKRNFSSLIYSCVCFLIRKYHLK